VTRFKRLPSRAGAARGRNRRLEGARCRGNVALASCAGRAARVLRNLELQLRHRPAARHRAISGRCRMYSEAKRPGHMVQVGATETRLTRSVRLDTYPEPAGDAARQITVRGMTRSRNRTRNPAPMAARATDWGSWSAGVRRRRGLRAGAANRRRGRQEQSAPERRLTGAETELLRSAAPGNLSTAASRAQATGLAWRRRRCAREL
jgi:hypothetical protein